MEESFHIAKRTVQSILSLLNLIKSTLNEDKYNTLKNENIEEVQNIWQRIDVIDKGLSGIQTGWIDVRSSYNLRQLESSWKDFSNLFYHLPISELRLRFKKLIDVTQKTLGTLRITPTNRPQEESLRNRSTLEEQNRLESLNRKRAELKQQYEAALKENPIDEEKIKALKNQLGILGKNYVATKNTLNDIKTDSAEEKQMRKRIDDAFVFLSQDNHLENELAKLRWEYYIMLVLIPIVIGVFFVFYGIFLSSLHDLKLRAWCDYLPYTMTVPIAIGLLWLIVYLKNRASKIAIELSSRLYDLRYLEGLMKMTNSMSRSSSEALIHIEELITSLVESFLGKMAEKPLKEQNLSILEKQELENSPYWKILNEIKDFVKMIKA